MQGISFVAEYAKFLSTLHPAVGSQLLAELMPDRYKTSRWIVESLLKTKIKPKKIVLVGDGYSAYLVPMLITQFSPSSIMLVETKANLDVASIIHAHVQPRTTLICVEKTSDVQIPDAALVVSPRCEVSGNLGALRAPNNDCMYVAQGSDSKSSPFPTGNVDELHAGSGIIQFVIKDSLSLNSESRHMVIGTKTVF